MALTLAEILDLPVVRAGKPTVVVGADRLDTEIGWVHVTELLDVDSVLSGGEMVLTTGLFLASAPPSELEAFVQRLAAAGAGALTLELGRAFHTPPRALVGAASKVGLPLVTLARTVRFVEITQAVHTRIINEQHASLRFSHQVHEAFNSLSLEGARTQALLDRAAEIGGTPVVLEDLAHRVTAHALGGRAATAVLARWPDRSRSNPGTWVTAAVGPADRRSGRLVLPDASSMPPDAAQILADRAAQALTLAELLEVERISARQQHQTHLLTDLLADRSAGSWQVRAEAAGFAVAGPLVPMALATRSAGAGRAGAVRLADEITSAATDVALTALVSPIDTGAVAVVLAVGASTADDKLDRLLTAVRRRIGCPEGPLTLEDRHWAVATGPVGADLGAVADGLREAAGLARVAAGLGPDRYRPVHRLAELRARVLVHRLEDDPRLVEFAEQTLRPLRRADQRTGGRLAELLLTFLEVGGNKSLLARRSHLSRPTLYAKLTRISELLDVDLDDGETRLALHLALLLRAEA